jgi:hypothetical protein
VNQYVLTLLQTAFQEKSLECWLVSTLNTATDPETPTGQPILRDSRSLDPRQFLWLGQQHCFGTDNILGIGTLSGVSGISEDRDTTYSIGQSENLVSLLVRRRAFALFGDDTRKLDAENGFGGLRGQGVLALSLHNIHPVKTKVLAAVSTVS